MGLKDSRSVLLQGLESMEYRGYDSAGLALIKEDGRPRVFRTVGSLEELKTRALKPKAEKFFKGMGHTRWATHGLPSEKNTHPHHFGTVYLVHNGIIENAEELKKSLKGPFHSETDSEVVAHLLHYALKKHSSWLKAVAEVWPKLKGLSAFLAFSTLYPREFVAFKKGPSLIVGFGKKEVFVASDPLAFAPHVKKTVFLEDGELAHIQEACPPCFYFLTKNRGKCFFKKIRKSSYVLKSDKSPVVGLKNRPAGVCKAASSYMLKEIEEQPPVLSRIIKTHLNLKTLRLKFTCEGQGGLKPVAKAGTLKIVACGSSYYAALYGKYVIEQIARLPVEVDRASEFLYRNPVLNKAPVLLISQSGETADTLAALKMAKQSGSPVWSLCNVKNSFLDRSCVSRMYMQAGVEKAVASTKAFSATVLVLLLMALTLAKEKKHLDRKEEAHWVSLLKALPSQFKKILSDKEIFISSAAYLKSFKGLMYLARGLFYPLSLEGALKIKELTYQPVEAYPAGEMKHGPLALVDKNTALVALVPDGLLGQKTLINLMEAKVRGARIIVVAGVKNQQARSLADVFIPLDLKRPLAKTPHGKNRRQEPQKEGADAHDFVFSLLCIPPLQMLAYFKALAMGHNVDRPRNLAKSVTVE